MDQLTSSTVFWLTTAVAFLLINTVILRALQKRKSSPAAAAAAAPPPVVQGVGLVRFVRAMARDGPLEAIREQQAKLGSVFTASAPLGLFKVTFLIGSEVSSHFYVASYSEISMGRLYEFTVPIFGPGVLYGVDLETRKEQIRFNWDILKPRSLKASVGAMAEEVEVI
nr:putative sterol 14-demethylase-like protein [Oryza sativa Japonica Group]